MNINDDLHDVIFCHCRSIYLFPDFQLFDFRGCWKVAWLIFPGLDGPVKGGSLLPLGVTPFGDLRGDPDSERHGALRVRHAIEKPTLGGS
jgi:hypothetical protein